MLSVLTNNTSCLFRKKHAFLQFGRAISYRFQDISLNCRKSPSQGNMESRGIANRTKLLQNHTWRILKVPARNFLKYEPEQRPFLKSNPEKDGLSKSKYELIYLNDSYLVYKRAGDLLLLVSLMLIPGLCYSFYTDTERKDVDFRKPMELPLKYQSVFGGVVFISFVLGCFTTIRRSPYRIYKLRSSRGLNSEYVAILPDRIISTKQLPFSLLEYKELPKPHGLMRSMLLGNTYIKNKGCVVIESSFVSPHFHNELNGYIG
ncbi:uncharacterized protein LOC117338077 [Pecten maximus]|uniref:uncharacterized protein LOC117338077 n=1 Tax=Pecten maximus TaxID=6579 RepID=UPI00145822A4|nr:uncharacterized protein LOC117338077 [Pecten maximus]